MMTIEGLVNDETLIETVKWDLQAISNLKLNNIEVASVDLTQDHIKYLIHGGSNGGGDWIVYLTQMIQIVNALDAWIIDLKVDCLDDVWTLTIGVDY